MPLIGCDYKPAMAHLKTVYLHILAFNSESLASGVMSLYGHKHRKSQEY